MKYTGKTAVILASYTLADPVTRNTIYSIADVFGRIIVIQQNSTIRYEPLTLKNIEIINIADFTTIGRFFGLKSFFKWVWYKYRLNQILATYNPDLIISFMLYPLSALKLKATTTLFACIYDIPPEEGMGKMDDYINKLGFAKLKEAQLIWASDEFKARLVMHRSHITTMPVVCHNCPPKNYIDYKTSTCKNWLREKLIQCGAKITTDNASVLLRAGAIGELSGIEETIEALLHLPENYIFLMIGRPDKTYENKIIELVNELNLTKRVFLWHSPNDQIWRRTLAGADIGNLIHIKPPAGSIQRQIYDLNSSLSNNRLYQYLSVGLPILSYEDARMDAIYKEINCFKILDTSKLTKEIVRAWKYLEENTDVKFQLGENARLAFEKKYNWEGQFEPVKKIMVNSI
jgi:glycosyltransferase involved in cell wall biosynthesis